MVHVVVAVAVMMMLEAEDDVLTAVVVSLWNEGVMMTRRQKWVDLITRGIYALHRVE